MLFGAWLYIAGSALDCKVVHHTIAKITFITIYLAVV